MPAANEVALLLKADVLIVEHDAVERHSEAIDFTKGESRW